MSERRPPRRRAVGRRRRVLRRPSVFVFVRCVRRIFATALSGSSKMHGGRKAGREAEVEKSLPKAESSQSGDRLSVSGQNRRH